MPCSRSRSRVSPNKSSDEHLVDSKKKKVIATSSSDVAPILHGDLFPPKSSHVGLDAFPSNVQDHSNAEILRPWSQVNPSISTFEIDKLSIRLSFLARFWIVVLSPCDSYQLHKGSFQKATKLEDDDFQELMVLSGYVMSRTRWE